MGNFPDILRKPVTDINEMLLSVYLTMAMCGGKLWHGARGLVGVLQIAALDGGVLSEEVDRPWLVTASFIYLFFCSAIPPESWHSPSEKPSW